MAEYYTGSQNNASGFAKFARKLNGVEPTAADLEERYENVVPFPGFRSITSLADLADERIWVAWRVEQKKDGNSTKLPKNPATGGNAQVPTNPETYGTRAAAEKRWQSIEKNIENAVGGIGIVLGDLPKGYLIGIDLDSCRDANGAIANWAQEVIVRFNTYAEISPSGTGVKLFCLLSADDMSKLLDLLGTNTDGKQLTRKTFAAGKHREVAIDTARFYAITEQRLDDCPESLRLVPYADVEWFIKVAGPNYWEKQKSGNGHNPNGGTDATAFGRLTAKVSGSGKQLDESGSGHGFRFMQKCRAEGMSYEAACEAILADEGDAGEWANRVDERQLQRAYGRSEPKSEETQEQKEPRFPLIAFNELKLSTARNYRIKGLFPSVGLMVIWGPPKCLKSFWAMDATLHVAQGWEYRGRKVQQGAVVYCAFEGASGFGARAAGFRKEHKLSDEQYVPFHLSPLRMNLIKDHKALIKDIKLQTIEPAIVVLDTLNRSLEGTQSKDEDMGAYIDAADAIRETFNCLVIIVHHCGIDGTRPRGHTSLGGVVAAQLKVDREPGELSNTVTVEWMRDGPDGDVVASDFEVVVVGVDDDGEEISTLSTVRLT